MSEHERTTPPPTTSVPADHDPVRLADRIHSAAIHLLRRLRVADRESGLSGPRLSALSVIVFRGPIAMGELAAAEQVRPPTMTRLVRDLVTDGLAARVADPDDRRVQRVVATARGRALLAAGRARRVAALATRIAALEDRERGRLGDALALLERLARDAGHDDDGWDDEASQGPSSPPAGPAAQEPGA